MPSALLEHLALTLGDRYHVDRELAGGGMSRVFVAQEHDPRRPVVVKVLPPELSTALSIERFRREIAVAAALQHPNIVPLLSAGRSTDVVYYLMPYVDGESLRVRLQRLRQPDGLARLPLDEVTRILHELARAIAYAHRKGIVHRDIKPGNILLSDDAVQVTDFGVAMAMAVAHEDAHVTQPGERPGTAAYMAPEQAQGDPRMDHRVDIYAFGVVAYELLAGTLPSETLRSGAAPKPIAEIRPDAAPALTALVTRCLVTNPDARPQSAAEVCDALADLRGYRRPARRRRVALAAAALVVLAGSVAALIPTEIRSLVLTVITRPPAVLVPHRYLVAPFDNRTSDASLDALGFEAADWIGQGLTRIPGIQAVDARTAVLNKRLVDRMPWPLRPFESGVAQAREASAAILISGSYYKVGDSLRFQARMTDVATGSLLQTVQDVMGRASDAPGVISQLQQRIVGTVALISDTGVVALPGSYSDPPSTEAYRELLAGWEAYFAGDSSMFGHLHRAARLDSQWVTPLVFLGYLDGWNARVADYEADTLRAGLLRARMTPAERSMFDYVCALGQADLAALLQAAQRFNASTAGSMESPLLVSSTALGLRQPAAAQRALAGVDPNRGLNLVGGYYWQSKVGLDQSLHRRDAVIADAREGERHFPSWIILHVYEARALAAAGDSVALRRAIGAAQMRNYSDDVARAVVAAHAAATLEFRGRHDDARTLAETWWPAIAPLSADTTKWVEEAYADLALSAQRWPDLARMPSPAATTSGRVYADRISWIAVAHLHMGDTAFARRADALLASRDPRLDYGFRELARARIAAHLGDSADALKLLRQAIAEGVRLKLFWGFDFLEDPYLVPLRTDPAFIQLLPESPASTR